MDKIERKDIQNRISLIILLNTLHLFLKDVHVWYDSHIVVRRLKQNHQLFSPSKRNIQETIKRHWNVWVLQS